MKLCRFRPAGWPAHLVRAGAVVGHPGHAGAADEEVVIVDVAAALAWAMVHHEGADPDAAARYALTALPGDGPGLLGTWQRTKAQVAELLGAVADGSIPADVTGVLGPATHRRRDVALLAPVGRPPTLRDFFAFEDHMRDALGNLGLEVPAAWYEAPSHYITRSASVFGPDEAAVWPHYTEKLDYELEFGVVIGTGGRDIPADEAWDHIAGFTIFNDLSCRDVQPREMGTHVGPAKTKGFDGGSAMGPYLVTADEFSRPFDVGMRAFVNGELWSKGRSGSIYWPVDALIEHAAKGETLLPGDVLGSGTVGTGAGIEIDRWIAPGDVVRLEIDGIGALEHTLERAEAPAFTPVASVGEPRTGDRTSVGAQRT